MPLGEMSTEVFLSEYWQKKPLLIRQGFPDFQSPITADELAGLSCEEGVSSRIVIEKGGDHPWQAIFGPMDEAVFAHLPATHWTLLVNDVEKQLPELIEIVDKFRFIPEWRVDDLMISYAPEGGSVGPHLDQYDVFILQAQGHRHWKIHHKEVAEDNLIEGADLRVQKNFVADQEWLLESGDVLYIPPGVSHYGVATDDCLSFSIGFRSPTHVEMLSDFIAYITKDLPAALTYRDPALSAQRHPNEISADTIEKLKDIFSEYLKPDHPALLKWFGRFVSDTRTDGLDEENAQVADINALMILHPVLLRNPASRFAFSRKGDEALLFVDGDDFEVSASFAERLCEYRTIQVPSFSSVLSNKDSQLFVQLYNAGKLLPGWMP